MPKLKTLSGRDVIKILAVFGFIVIAQRGSHVKLVRTLPDSTKQPLTIPAS
ncbi:MAG: type II toxin-antitoxin system HicA family toxin [Thermodesulfobacteriota bacterium]